MERPVYGVVLTAGSQEKTRGGYRLEPDLEGKLRLIPAIKALASGETDRILIAGGATNYGLPLAKIYANYARRFKDRINNERGILGLAAIHEDSIIEVKGGVHTPSDLAKTKQLLMRRGWHVNLELYSSSYQFLRRAVIDFVRDYEIGGVSCVPSENELPKRRASYAKVAKGILTDEFVNRMIKRNLQIDKHPKFVEHVAAYLDRAIKPEIEKQLDRVKKAA